MTYVYVVLFEWHVMRICVEEKDARAYAKKHRQKLKDEGRFDDPILIEKRPLY